MHPALDVLVFPRLDLWRRSVCCVSVYAASTVTSPSCFGASWPSHPAVGHTIRFRWLFNLDVVLVTFELMSFLATLSENVGVLVIMLQEMVLSL